MYFAIIPNSMTDLLTILIQMPLKHKVNFEEKVLTSLCSPRQKDEMQDVRACRLFLFPIFKQVFYSCVLSCLAFK